MVKKQDPKGRADLELWRETAERELRDGGADSLETETAEGIRWKPLYTAADLEDL